MGGRADTDVLIRSAATESGRALPGAVLGGAR